MNARFNTKTFALINDTTRAWVWAIALARPVWVEDNVAKLS